MNTNPKTIKIYRAENGKEPFVEWINSLPVKDRARIFARLDRVETGNTGDHKSLGDGVWELRFYFGPGYRIYYGEIGAAIVLLLSGGDKSSQKRDVKRAKILWENRLKRREP
ncbi:Addiction module killer protein [Candidatus Desulfarcum epimagneticum]|uniref:Addiction module killer protein n=1 Tax=uncultured Desulfobacteraceae bacterium TaxID=218296 RepID=A0A484HE71_9BACT|nr:Addiction module killer protein [uncultured Desulfobacteraceae bacterium]